ncbi:hypothetical protein GGR21_003310 [Dysgonomonas hofstadii]|uniref:DUF4987 domain-containing protein n=1 Tax=Dysgonomonas hofstadii TaxID=637886 RepID=A0A840CZI3_9BACT|nr:DUF4302 domain-containing protein [Dysgonomonas hofstadii]MBB4037393.1 hypothetical protein [Dysgonomonas hofstadii]
MRNLKYYILFFAGILLMPSCLHEEEDIFGKSASERLNEAQLLYEKILTTPSKGWVLEYIAGDTDATRRGAFNYLLKFENGEVTAAVDQNALYDIAPAIDPYTQITSYYKLEQDMSITLSFDTYNSFLHYYHEQHGSYTTYKGDFEFTIMEAYDDLVILRGKKYGNIMEMHRLADDVTWDEYLQDVNTVYNQSLDYPEFSIFSGANVIAKGSVLETRQFSFSYENVDYLKSVIYTTTGLKFLEPLVVEGKEAQNFVWDVASATFTCTDNGATGIVIQMTIPAEYVKYSEYLGTYTFKYTNLSGVVYNETINLVQHVNGRSYIAENFTKGITGAVTILQFDKSTARLCIGAHTVLSVGTDDNYNLYPMIMPPTGTAGNFYAGLGDAYGRFWGKLTSTGLISMTRDPSGSLTNVTAGFRVIRRQGTSNYGTNAANSYTDMSFQKQ